MKSPIDGKWILYYDKVSYIIKECFELNPGVEISEDRLKELPENRLYTLPNWRTFEILKDSLDYPPENQIPAELNITDR